MWQQGKWLPDGNLMTDSEEFLIFNEWLSICISIRMTWWKLVEEKLPLSGAIDFGEEEDFVVEKLD